MRLETITYLPVKIDNFGYDFHASQIPDHIRRELSGAPPKNSYVSVDANKKNIVQYLDHYFEVDISQKYRKSYYLEIDKTEIDQYDYFKIILNCLDMGKDIFGSIKKPTCPIDGCSHGSKLIGPVRIYSRKAKKKAGFYQLHRPWSRMSEFIIASWVVDLFEQKSITGLKYEPCFFEDEKNAEKFDIKPPFLARIQKKISEYADDIYCKYLCEEHRIIYTSQLFNLKLYREDIPPGDIYGIDNVIVNGQIYYHLGTGIMVSKKLLKLLLKHKVPGLSIITPNLNQKFEPIILSSRNTEEKEIIQ